MLFAQSSAMNWTLDNNSKTEGNVDIENAVTDRDENLAKIEIATLAIIFLVTVLGNGTVLLALWTRRRYAGRKKLSRMYFFILHLSIADLITAFLSVLPQLGWEVTYRFYGGFVLCKLVKYGQTLGPYLSSYVLMATAVDRHQAICYPLTYCSWTSRRSKVMVWLAWATSLAFCTPQVYSYDPSKSSINEGHIYEWKLAALVSLRLCNINKDFNLLINADNFDKWDDIVIVVQDGEKKKIYCLQLKHVTGKTNEFLREDMFEPNKDGIMNLTKMFKGYQTIMKNLATNEPDDLFQNVDVNNLKLILFTNIKGKLIIGDNTADECIDILKTKSDEESNFETSHDNNREDKLQKEEEKVKGVVIDLTKFERNGGTEEQWGDFFEHLFYIGNQIGQDQLDSLIEIEIAKFLQLDNEMIPRTTLNYFLEYINRWAYGKLEGFHTLTKTHIRAILAEILISTLEVVIPPNNLVDDDVKVTLPDNLSEDVTFGHEEWNTLVNNKSLVVLQHVDKEMLNFIFLNIMQYQNSFGDFILKILQDTTINNEQIMKALQSKDNSLKYYLSKNCTNSSFSTNYVRLLFWKLGLLPLVIRARKSSDTILVCKSLDITAEHNTKIILLLDDINSLLPEHNITRSFIYLNDVETNNLPMISNKCLNIHGHKYNIQQLLNICPALKTKLTASNILKIITRNCSVGQIFELKSYHIQRSILSIRLSTEILNNKSDIFVICGKNATMRSLECIPNVSISGCVEYDNENKVNKEALERCRIFLIESADEEKCYNIYQKICSFSIPKNIHFIKMHFLDNTVFLQWRRTQGTTEILRSNRMASDSLFKEEIESIAGKINVLSGDPGYGKTTIMYQLAQRQREEGYLIVFITLADHVEGFMKLEKGTAIELLKHLFTFKSVDIKVDLNIFDAFLQEGRILVIFDGMDEISREHKDNVFKFIQEISSLRIRIWITCRICVEEEVENKLNTIAFRLNGFSESEQKQYLKQFSSTDLKAEDILKAEQQELHEIPLYLFMLCKSSSDSSDVISLCENFIKTEINKCCAKNKLASDHAERFSKKLERFLGQYALHIIFPAAAVQQIVDEVSLKEDLDYYINFKYASFGLIRNSSNKIEFTHKKICDYIASKALVELTNESKSVIKKYLFDEKLTSLRVMFHKLKIRALHNSELKAAVIEMDHDAVKKCLQNKYTEDIGQDYTTSLHLAAQWGIRHYYQPEGEPSFIDESLCYRANDEGTEEVVQMLLSDRKMKKLTFQKDKLLSWTPINYADHSESLGVLNQFAKIETFDLTNSQLLSDMPKSTLLYFCIRYHYNYIFDVLFDNSDINWKLRCGDLENTFLHCACAYGNTYVLDVLLEKPLIDVVNKKGETALHVAAYGHKNVVSQLLSKQLSLEVTDNEGYTPLHRAVKCGQTEISEMLIKHKADINTSSLVGHSLIHTAAYINQVSLLNLLISKGADINCKDNMGNLPLHTAIEWISTDCVKILVEKTNNINYPNKSNETPLDLSVRSEQLDMVKTLTRYGANVLKQDITMDIPLSIKTYLEPIVQSQLPQKYISRPGTVNLGMEFEVKMAALLSLRCCASGTEEMCVAMNARECGIFDDIFLHVKLSNGRRSSHLIQVKHHMNPKNITLSEFEAAKGQFSLTKYAEDMKCLRSVIDDHMATKSSINQYLKISDDIVFTLFTNRNVSNDRFNFMDKLNKQPSFLKIVDTGGHIYKLNLLKFNSDVNDYMYLFTKQVNNININYLLQETFKSLVNPLQLPSQVWQQAITDYIVFVGNLMQGKLGGHYFLTKDVAINFISDILLRPYMILYNSDVVDLACGTQHVAHISNAIVSTKSLTIVNSNENCSSNMCQEILNKLKAWYTDLPSGLSWTEPFSNEDQMTFYESNHNIKMDLIRMVGYAGDITLLDIYKCTWVLGKLPLILDVSSLQDYRNIKAVHDLSHGRLKLALLNSTNQQLSSDN